MTKYEVTFQDTNTGDRWTATYVANSFARVEEQALLTLEMNKDKTSEIHKIERW